MRKSLLLAEIVLTSLNPVFAADSPLKLIDTEKSLMTVRVFKAGFFSAFAGHEHEISAPVESGSFSVENSTVELGVDARKLRVMDKDVSDKDRAEIQQTMLGPKVLDSERFPEIRFRSSSAARQADGKWLLKGELTVHGQARPIQVLVQERAGHYVGAAEVKQRDFGITPVTVGGGAVKVKNELRVEFDIVGK
ncbi:MAG TPA: YceI family protein [Terriglobales bacterium]|jgi:polyisoprenoid-binding protein YceI